VTTLKVRTHVEQWQVQRWMADAGEGNDDASNLAREPTIQSSIYGSTIRPEWQHDQVSLAFFGLLSAEFLKSEQIIQKILQTLCELHHDLGGS